MFSKKKKLSFFNLKKVERPDMVDVKSQNFFFFLNEAMKLTRLTSHAHQCQTTPRTEKTKEINTKHL